MVQALQPTSPAQLCTVEGQLLQKAVSPSSSMQHIPSCLHRAAPRPLFFRRHLPLPAVPPAWLPAGGGGATDVPSRHITPEDVYREADFIRGCADTLEVISFNRWRSGFCGLLLSSLLTIPEKHGLLCSCTDGKRCATTWASLCPPCSLQSKTFPCLSSTKGEDAADATK